MADLRTILNHYRVSNSAYMDKISLMHELDVLTRQRGLTVTARRGILAAARAGTPMPARRPLIRNTRTTARSRMTQQHVVRRSQQRGAPHELRRREPNGRRTPGPQNRHQDQARAVPVINLFPNLPRAVQRVDSSPVTTDAGQIKSARPPQGSHASSNTLIRELPEDTTNTNLNGRECVVCLETLRQDEFPGRRITASCDHDADVCLGCTAQHIASEIRDKMWDRIACPTCIAVLAFQDVKEFADQETFERYDQLALEACLSNGSFQKCRNPSCTVSQQHDEGDSFIRCNECHSETCIPCDVLMHSGVSCADFQAERAQRQQAAQEPATARYLASNSTACPSCGVRRDKVDGCDHITCPQCRHEYCWQCLADYNQVRLVGNTAHGRDCPYHSNNVPGMVYHPPGTVVRQVQAAARAARFMTRNASRQ